MKNRLTARVALVAGLALIVLTNAVTLGLVAWNRSGEPEAVLSLSERELERPWSWRMHRRENSGLALELRWRLPLPPTAADGSNEAHESWNYGGEADWLDAAKLEALGFPPPDPDRRKYERRRTVLLVLEHDGDAYRRALERAQNHLAAETALRDANPGAAEFAKRVERAQKRLDEETGVASRLFAIDAGLDLGRLRAQYPDRRRYAIVTARIRPAWHDPRKPGARRGYIESIEAGTINVPLALRDAVPPDAGRRVGPKGERADRFDAELAFGRRLEPWLLQVRANPGGSPSAADAAPITSTNGRR